MQKYTYDTKRFTLKEQVEFKFKQPFEAIKDNIEVLTREKDQSTVYHKLFYQYASCMGFKLSWEYFIKHCIYPLYKQPIVYQAIPTFRVCFPNNVAVGEFHKDKHYRDAEWAAKVKEDNFFLPFTDAYDTNTIWVESLEDKGDFAPMNCKYGEFIKWDGSNLTHGNKINTTGKTRVSVDFRVMLLSNYIASETHSINTPTKFKIGEYYKLMK